MTMIGIILATGLEEMADPVPGPPTAGDDIIIDGTGGAKMRFLY
jgi:hypothetical protein